MLDRVAVMRMQIEPTPANLQAIFQLHFDVLFDWKLPHNVKKFFSSSITESLDIWQEGKLRVMQNWTSFGRLLLRLVLSYWKKREIRGLAVIKMWARLSRLPSCLSRWRSLFQSHTTRQTCLLLYSSFWASSSISLCSAARPTSYGEWRC
jgi:hypothetical protein